MKREKKYDMISVVIEMKDELLINDVVKEVNELLLNLEVYYTIKNINRID